MDIRRTRGWVVPAALSLIFASLLLCAKKAANISWPSSIPAQSLLVSSDPGRILSVHLGRLPDSFAAAFERHVAQGRDSLVLFYLVYPSRQGTVAAFQEWLQVADRGRSQSPLKNIGAKAVEFESGFYWILFYSGKAVFGVGHPRPETCRGIAQAWANDQDS